MMTRDDLLAAIRERCTMDEVKASVKTLELHTKVSRIRQDQFEHTASNTYGRILLFTGINGAILIGTAVWQALHLKQFFKDKKVA